MGAALIIDASGLDTLLKALESAGYEVVGPRLRDGAIAYDSLSSAADLPAGWTDRQAAGSYRLERRQDGALFGYAVGPHSWKRFLHPPLARLWRAVRRRDTFEIDTDPEPPPQRAFFGVRPCELHAVAIQDRVFLAGEHVDPLYRARREASFLIAVNCGQPSGTCFCASMGTGPKAASGFDLALTEVLEEGVHHFVVECGSERGAAMVAGLALRLATEEELAAAERVVERAARQMGRQLEADGLRDVLYRHLEHPRWDEIAERCLACANCTLVCPTCFCTSVEDLSDLAGSEASRQRRWDSCFTHDFSYLHGGGVRQSTRARYRQWMTHKLASWHDQFGTSGCVGCGRCITWCPAAIDITEEAAAFRAADASDPRSREVPQP